MSDLKIRALEADDEADWRPLWQGYLEFYATVLPEKVTAITWQRLLDPSEPMYGLVAVLQGGIAGFAHCVLHRGTWSLTQHCYLEDLYVDRGTRRPGPAGGAPAAGSDVSSSS